MLNSPVARDVHEKNMACVHAELLARINMAYVHAELLARASSRDAVNNMDGNAKFGHYAVSLQEPATADIVKGQSEQRHPIPNRPLKPYDEALVRDPLLAKQVERRRLWDAFHKGDPAPSVRLKQMVVKRLAKNLHEAPEECNNDVSAVEKLHEHLLEQGLDIGPANTVAFLKKYAGRPNPANITAKHVAAAELWYVVPRKFGSGPNIEYSTLRPLRLMEEVQAAVFKRGGETEIENSTQDLVANPTLPRAVETLKKFDIQRTELHRKKGLDKSTNEIARLGKRIKTHIFTKNTMKKLLEIMPDKPNAVIIIKENKLTRSDINITVKYINKRITDMRSVMKQHRKILKEKEGKRVARQSNSVIRVLAKYWLARNGAEANLHLVNRRPATNESLQRQTVAIDWLKNRPLEWQEMPIPAADLSEDSESLI